MSFRFQPDQPTTDHHRRDLLRVLCASATGLALGGKALALTGGGGPQDADAGAPWASVGSLDNGQGLFTATPVGRRHVVTAAHIVNGAQPLRVSFRLSHGAGFVSVAEAIHVHPGFRGQTTQHNAPGDPTVHHDLAVVRLARPLPDRLDIPRIFPGDLQGRTATLVSHGGSTSLWTVGENRLDAVFRDALGQPVTYLFDYDGPDLSSNRIGPAVPVNGSLGPQREATLVSGDSGSAAFVHFDSQWWLAGVNTFQLSIAGAGAGAHGSAAGGVVLASQADWLRGLLTQA